MACDAKLTVEGNGSPPEEAEDINAFPGGSWTYGGSGDVTVWANLVQDGVCPTDEQGQVDPGSPCKFKVAANAVAANGNELTVSGSCTSFTATVNTVGTEGVHSVHVADIKGTIPCGGDTCDLTIELKDSNGQVTESHSLKMECSGC
ncbi:MAG: hypothetical protein ACPG4T_20830 [Nannocystaceae bacterium]